MARDPDTFRVGPTLTNLPKVQAPEVQNAGPEQLVNAGRAITNAGALGAQIFEAELQEQNKARVTEAMTALTKYRNERTYGEDGWTKAKGRNALERPDGKTLMQEYGEDLEKEIEALAMGLGNDAQRKVFRDAATNMSLQYSQKLQEHVAAEGENYKRETYAGMADEGSMQLAMATTPDEVIEATGMIRSAAGEIFKLNGTPEEAQGEVLRQLLTPGHTAQLSRMMSEEDVDGAEQYLNEHRDDMTPEAITKVNNALVEQRAIIEGENWGEELYGTSVAQVGATAPEDVIMPLVGDATLSGVFGEKRSGRAPEYRHGGIDIKVGVGTDVVAGASGVVRVRSGKKYGTYVDLELDDGTVLRNAHLSGTTVKDGTRVNKGDVIAKSGGARGAPGSGNSTGPHLHYEVRVNGAPVDPREWHQSQPKTQGAAAGSSAGRPSLKVMLEEIYADDTRTARQKQEAERVVRSLYAADKEAQGEQDAAIANKAYEEIDSTGSLSSATRAALVGANMGDMLPALRNFEKATQDRAAGVAVNENDGLEAYGRVQVGIANGEIRDIADLMQFKPYVPANLFKQLVDDFAASPQTARQKTADIVKEMKTEIQASGLFTKDGKQTPETKAAYNRFIGGVTSAIAGRELNDQTVDREERRSIVLGMLAESVVNGERMRNYDVREIYNSVPPRARLAITRRVEQYGGRATQNAVVEAWLGMTPDQQSAYGR